jgi:hypothetical protein
MGIEKDSHGLWRNTLLKSEILELLISKGRERIILERNFVLPRPRFPLATLGLNSDQPYNRFLPSRNYDLLSFAGAFDQSRKVGFGLVDRDGFHDTQFSPHISLANLAIVKKICQRSQAIGAKRLYGSVVPPSPTLWPLLLPVPWRILPLSSKGTQCWS